MGFISAKEVVVYKDEFCAEATDGQTGSLRIACSLTKSLQPFYRHKPFHSLTFGT
jgi:hypothetical protein